MTTQLVLQALMIFIGYFGVSRLVAIEHRKYGLAVCFVVNILLIMLQSHISPWPFRHAHTAVVICRSRRMVQGCL
jgi:hypothetical protein